MTYILSVKPLTADLLPAVVELDQKCFAGLWTLDGYQRELDSPNSDILLILAAQPESPEPGEKERLTEKSKIPQCPIPKTRLLAMGCQWAILDEAHITIVAVDPAYQNQGLGQAMLLALLKAARLRGLERATLEVKASNQPAIALYEKFGFQVAGRRRGYYQDTDEDALILWLGGLQRYSKFSQTLAEWEQQVRLRLGGYGWELEMENC